jgi:hypothetical protein
MALPTSVFSRILTIVGVLSVLIAAYWFITTSLTPYPVPPAAPRRGAVTFDPKVDVSKDAVFRTLRPLAGFEVEIGQIGRPNPFVPPAPSPLIISPTTTESSTGTPPLIISPVIVTPSSTGPDIQSVPSSTTP